MIEFLQINSIIQVFVICIYVWRFLYRFLLNKAYLPHLIRFQVWLWSFLFKFTWLFTIALALPAKRSIGLFFFQSLPNWNSMLITTVSVSNTCAARMQNCTELGTWLQFSVASSWIELLNFGAHWLICNVVDRHAGSHGLQLFHLTHRRMIYPWFLWQGCQDFQFWWTLLFLLSSSINKWFGHFGKITHLILLFDSCSKFLNNFIIHRETASSKQVVKFLYFSNMGIQSVHLQCCWHIAGTALIHRTEKWTKYILFLLCFHFGRLGGRHEARFGCSHRILWFSTLMGHWTIGLHIWISLFAWNTSVHGIVSDYGCVYLLGFLWNCWFVIHLRLMLSTLISSLVPGVEEIFQLRILPEDISTSTFAVWALRHFAFLSIF